MCGEDGEEEAGAQPPGLRPEDHPQAGQGEHCEDGAWHPGILVQGFTGEQHHAGRRVAYIEIIRINREGKAK